MPTAPQGHKWRRASLSGQALGFLQLGRTGRHLWLLMPPAGHFLFNTSARFSRDPQLRHNCSSISDRPAAPAPTELLQAGLSITGPPAPGAWRCAPRRVTQACGGRFAWRSVGPDKITLCHRRSWIALNHSQSALQHSVVVPSSSAAVWASRPVAHASVGHHRRQSGLHLQDRRGAAQPMPRIAGSGTMHHLTLPGTGTGRKSTGSAEHTVI